MMHSDALGNVPISFLGLNAAEWDALAQVLLAIGAMSAAGWATFTYWKGKRAEAARWAIEVFRDFYRDPNMSRARELIEYDFESVAGPLLELRVLDRQISLTDDERSQLQDIDLVLNFLEQLLYLEDEGHFLARDRQVFFEYWFERLALPEHAALRRYLRNCGYERCSEFLKLDASEHFVAYGSLMTGHGEVAEHDARKHLESLGPCTIRGDLYSRGEFPALARGDREIEAELFRVTSPSAWPLLDAIEHYDPDNRAKSIYRRHCVSTEDPKVDAWVYFWNDPLDDLEAIPSGSWARFAQDRRPS